MIDVNNESGTEVDELGLLQLAEFALAQLRIHPQAELSILLVDEAAMAELHQRFMDQQGRHIDRCVLYVFRCAVHFAENPGETDKEKLKWWNWMDGKLG